MPNATKIRETLAVARANLPRLKMATWADGHVDPNARSWEDCGATFCLAGWRCALDGLRPQVGKDGNATGQFITSDGRVQNPDTWAMESMGLTYRQGFALFNLTADIRDIDALDWVAEQIIAGYDLDECEACEGTARRLFGSPCRACDGHGLVIYYDSSRIAAEKV